MVVKHPLISWAQRSSHIYLSIEIGDLHISELVAEKKNFTFKGEKDGEAYSADLTLFKEVKGDELRKIETDRRVELVIPKETAEWWPRLLNDKIKFPWIKVDFNKWVDEEEEDEKDDYFGDFGANDFSKYSNNFEFDKRMNLEDEDEEMGELEDVENDQNENENENDQKIE